MSEKTYYAEITCRAVGLAIGDFQDEMIKIATELYSLDDGAGASLSADPKSMILTFGIMVSAPNKRVAMNTAATVARTSLHAAGGSTRNWSDAQDKWPSDFRRVHSSVQNESEALAL